MAAARIGSTKGRFVNERQLFHGTDPKNIEGICKHNFDWRLHGTNATVYGEGSYFALNSSYSDSYAKEDSKGSKFMFVAKVLVGSYTKGCTIRNVKGGGVQKQNKKSCKTKF